jgi:hypothetical protein
MSSAWLPSNAKPFTKALADANDSYTRLKGNVPTIAHIGRDTIPDGWLPWLLRNAGMQNVMAFVPEANWSTVYGDRAWVTYRGTAQAHVDALAWIGLTATYRDGPVDTDFYDHFDIVLDAFPVSHDALQRIVGLGFAAKSTASVYHRVIYGIDVDAARYAFNYRSGALYGTYSGVEWRPGWPNLSLRATVGGVGEAPDDGGIARCGTLALVGTHGTPDWHLRFGFSRHGYDRPGPWRSLGLTIVTYASGDAQDAPHSRLVHTDEPHGTRPLLDASATEIIE